MNIDLHRPVFGLLLAATLVGCTFAAPLDSPAPSGGAAATAAAATPAAATGAAPTQPVATPSKTRRPAPTPTIRPTRTPRPAATATATPRVTPRPTQQAEIPGLDGLLGTDGRFTMLVMGVDSRSRQLTGRTDTIMFVTIDPTTGKVAMASLPRDMVFVPIAPGKTFGSGFTRINALFAYLTGFGGGRKATFARMVNAMEYMSGIEIDRYAMIGFSGVRTLVDTVGGVDIKLPRPLIDPSMHVQMKGRRGEGLFLKAGKNHLPGNVALAFARTRHTDTDYERARRQQQLIAAAIGKVIKRGPAMLPGLLKAFDGRIKTDIDFADAPALLALAERAKLDSFKSTVLGPSKYAGVGDVQYSTKLKIDVVREFFQRQFGPVR